MRVVFVGRDRKAWAEALLAFLTFGITRRIWLYRINREIDGHQALGLRHNVTALLLAAPLLGLAVALVLLGAGIPFTPWGATVLALSFLPSGYVTLQTARRTAHMLAGSPVRYGPPGAIWAASLVPLFGSILFFIPWQQTRLNRFWAHERGQVGHGVEVDIDLGTDPRFLVEIGRALRESYYAGSRFETRRKAKRAKWAVRLAHWQEVRAERKAVRDAGGSTPLAPWAKPSRPAPRLLHVTCGRCQSRFDVRRDPAADTPLICPQCGQADVLPSLHSDPLRGLKPAAVPELKVDCPRCKTTFHALHNLYGPTELRCPNCGHSDTLPAGVAPVRGRSPQRRGKADRPETTRA